MDENTPRRRALRLHNYDYTQSGAYFVTLCIQGRTCLLGDIIDNAMHLNEFGRVVSVAWQWLPQQYPYVALDSFVVMPNHLHGILVMDCSAGGLRGIQIRGSTATVGVVRERPSSIFSEDGSRTAPTKIKPLGGLIAAFKTVSTKSINALQNTPGVILWQRNYYEHVIRNEGDLQRIREYIQNNPDQWALDKENPDRIK